MKDSIVNNPNEEDFLKQLKAGIERARREYAEGNFITHEEMIEELKSKKII
ncbi:hypothetical protein FLA105534_00296 [Flavobacterium bizetiae]|uniref:Uncharacterized protein n=1 Tax=Flavobacterium bizetiae TaxID=2704140 RepID=A0A6J4G7M2_9FLAO|nr:hypothetical protein [Flavobacterium bizetiae]CAA9194724.1 hypothetical protein FLA105534_00296 [Flavobacterium bizetiae]CAD5340678.1 hypothetical protein FLA105535_00633 [Flavobacterium bizetiae]CAD5346313.1 hypothetical protein FLA105534_00254 [Flavobacterium bizetiae]